MNTKILRSFVKAYNDLKLGPPDFEFGDKIVTEVMLLDRNMADELDNRLRSLHKKHDFEDRIFEHEQSVNSMHEIQIEYLKRQIALNELRSEISGIDSILDELKAQGFLNEDMQRVFHEKIEKLKKEIENKS